MNTRSLFELSTQEAYQIASVHFGEDLPSREAIDSEDWGRDYILERLAQLDLATLAAAGLHLDPG